MLVFAFVAALVVFSGEFSDHKWMNHDVANALYVGRRILSGELLYVDWYYFVTPPVVFLSAGACWVGNVLGLTPPTVIHLSVLATGMLGVLVIRQAFPRRSARAVVPVLAYLGLLTQAGVSPSDFAQREHFFALLFVPYLLWRLSGRPSCRSVWPLLVGLGYAAMIKPHFALVVSITELFCLGDRRRPAAVWASLLLGAALPFALLALHSTRSFAAFFSTAVPYHLSGAYSTYDSRVAPFLAGGTHLALLILGALLVAGAAHGHARGVVRTRTAAAAGVVSLALYLAIFHQHKFFNYHLMPFMGTTYVLAACFSSEIIGTLASKRSRAVARALVVLLLAAVIGNGLNTLGAIMARAPTGHFRPLLPLLEGQEWVMLMTPSVEGDLFAYTFSHELEVMGPWTSHYTVAPMLQIRDPKQREAALRQYFEPLAQRIRKDKPGLVLFSPFTQGMGGLSMHDVFVERYGLFPTPDYRVWKRTRNGWIVYKHVSAQE